MRLNLSLGALAGLQLLASFSYQLVILGAFGAGTATDAWVGAQAVPSVLFAILLATMLGAWQSRLAAAGADPAAWKQVQHTAQGQLWLVCAPLFAVLALTAHLWIDNLFPGFDAPQAALATSMTIPLLAAAVLNGQIALTTAAMRGRERFIACEFVVLAGGLLAIGAAVLLVPRHGIEIAAWITLARAAVVATALFVLAERPWPDPTRAWRDAEGWSAARPLLLGGVFYKSSPLVDRVFSSLTPSGGMTVFNIAQLCFGAVGTVLERAIATPQTPALARLAAQRQWTALLAIVRRNLLRGLGIPVAATTLLIVLQPWWELMLRPLLKVDPAQLHESWMVCIVLSLSLYPVAVGPIVVSTFYAIGDTTTIARVAVIGFAISIAVKYLAFARLGLAGLAAGVALHYLGNMLLLALLLRRRLRRLQLDASPSAPARAD